MLQEYGFLLGDLTCIVDMAMERPSRIYCLVVHRLLNRDTSIDKYLSKNGHFHGVDYLYSLRKLQSQAGHSCRLHGMTSNCWCAALLLLHGALLQGGAGVLLGGEAEEVAPEQLAARQAQQLCVARALPGLHLRAQHVRICKRGHRMSKGVCQSIKTSRQYQG